MAEQDLSLEGKVALVAGASRGIGEATAKRLARNGATVIAASRKIADCETVAEAIRADGGKARAMALHLGEAEHRAAALDSIRSEEGRLDILVNCGATSPYFGAAIDTPESAWDKTFDVNLKGPFFLSSDAIRMMKETGGGAIVNVASINGMRPGFFQGAYSITKAAMISMTQVLAQEHGADGIRVNSLCPGLTETKLASALTSSPELDDMMKRNFSIQRVGQPEDMAAAIHYLASDASSYMTGQTLVVDGGILSRGPL
ncbi:short-chain dehydrogenase [Marinicauda salina]|uniref:Short-chain dehydrogenase n=1 Tax=Marinicauda salina TaxID=2135793 RepID=A0A2U2BVS5_9PROT|nr:glucose 1-dehydrogenase [Marinicauda salina]PWE18125.1 short-chain dehydrogenase [Marinicauda salina]